jgi:hypothetical protein
MEYAPPALMWLALYAKRRRQGNTKLAAAIEMTALLWYSSSVAPHDHY